VSDEVSDTAIERYDLDVRPASRWKVPFFAAVAIALGVFSDHPMTYGGRRATVVDRRGADVVGRFRERPIVGDASPLGLMLTAYHEASAADFENVWLHGPDNRVRRGNDAR
jgi:hypothetical protein